MIVIGRFRRHCRSPHPQVCHATGKVTKMLFLTARMLDAVVSPVQGKTRRPMFTARPPVDEICRMSLARRRGAPPMTTGRQPAELREGYRARLPIALRRITARARLATPVG